MPQITWVHVAAGVVLILGALPLARLVFRVDLNAPMFVAMLKKLVDSGNVDRAIKLSTAAPSSPIARGARGMLQAFTSGATDATELRDAFERAAGGLSRAVLRWSWLSWLALVGCAGIVGLAWMREFELAHEESGLGLAALAITLVGLRKAYAVRARFSAGREELLNHLQEAALRR